MSRSRRARRLVPLLAPVVVVWAIGWAALAVAGWRPRPLGLLATLVLLVALVRLAGALASDPATLPRVDVRATRSRPVGDDSRLLRHQLHLEDATADPPSCRPVLTRISELARERLRLAHGRDAGTGQLVDPEGRRLLGERLSTLLDSRPPDRTHLSPRELTRLVRDLEALADPADPAAHRDPVTPVTPMTPTTPTTPTTRRGQPNP
jgi:hypothetical protein